MKGRSFSVASIAEMAIPRGSAALVSNGWIGLALTLITALMVGGGLAMVVTVGTANQTQAVVSGPMFGVNLAGGEFGSNLPGTYDWDYTYPTAQELVYYKSKGILIIRVPFRWERLQKTLNAPLDSTEMSRIDRVVSDAHSRGMQVLLDCHNYGRYKINGSDEQLLGTLQVPNSAFADFWDKVAYRYKNESTVYGYGLMNEPHDMGDDKRWPATAQAAVNAIRTVDSTQAVFVSGDHWSGAHSWRTTSNENLDIWDPANNLVYEAHQYFDDDHSGTYDQSYDAEGAYPDVGVDRTRPFVEWLQEKGKKGFIGEFGVPSNDPRWNTALNNFLSYIKNNNVGGTYWAGGPWWGAYPLSIEPTNNFTTDKPQMSVLQKYLAPSDTIQPEVSGVRPTDRQQEVSRSSEVEVDFSEEMDPNTLTFSSFFLTKQGSPTPVASSVSYEAQSKKAILNPDADLTANATYTATVKGGSSGARDVAGNTLVADKVWSFTTASSAGGVVVPPLHHKKKKKKKRHYH